MNWLRKLRDRARYGPGIDVRTGDRVLVAKIREAGADMSQPRQICHWFFFSREDPAVQARDELDARGYESELQPREGGVWAVVACQRMVVTVEAIELLRSSFED